jgi:hypothetical protein
MPLKGEGDCTNHKGALEKEMMVQNDRTGFLVRKNSCPGPTVVETAQLQGCGLHGIHDKSRLR